MDDLEQTEIVIDPTSGLVEATSDGDVVATVDAVPSNQFKPSFPGRLYLYRFGSFFITLGALDRLGGGDGWSAAG